MSDTDAHRELSSLLDDVVQASKVPAKRRAVSIKPSVEKLTSLAYGGGILPDDLATLVELITTPSHLDQASLAALAKSLYPVSNVGDEVVLKVLGCLGHGRLKPSLVIQGLLLRWLVLVYHVLDKPAVLSQAYAVLFNLLDTAAIRPQLSHLVALITRRNHVRPFRIQAILNLSRQTGADASIIGLLRVFKNYYPEVIVGDATKGKGASFKHPDPQWRTRLDEIRDAHQRSLLPSSDTPQAGFRVNHQVHARRRGHGGLAIPTVRTSHAKETSITLEEVDTAEGLVANLEKIELPNQLVAVLADPLLQKLMLLRPSNESQSRVDNWLQACISETASEDSDPDALMDLLEVVQDYIRLTHTLSPLLMDFLREVLRGWDGTLLRDVILGCLSYSHLADFDLLYSTTFQLLEERLLDGTSESQVALLAFYTSLLRQWSLSLRSADRQPVDGSTSLSGAYRHVSRLCVTLLQTSPTVATHMAVLDFFQQVIAIVSTTDLQKHTHEVIPPPALVYILHFSQSAAVVSRLAFVLATYKRTLETMMKAYKHLGDDGRDRVNIFNGFLMDSCNCVWRNRAFVTTDPNALGCFIPPAVVPRLSGYLSGLDRDTPLASSFSLSHSPMTCLLAASFLREQEETAMEATGTEIPRHAGPATQESLHQLGRNGGLQLRWQDYRIGVLRFLEERGLGGIPELMYGTLKNLRNPKTA